MSGLPIFGISRLRHCHVSFTCHEAEREAGDGGMLACVRACVRLRGRHIGMFQSSCV